MAWPESRLLRDVHWVRLHGGHLQRGSEDQGRSVDRQERALRDLPPRALVLLLLHRRLPRDSLPAIAFLAVQLHSQEYVLCVPLGPASPASNSQNATKGPSRTEGHREADISLRQIRSWKGC